MIHVLLAQGFEEIEAVGVIDILRRADLEVSIVSADNTAQVEGAHGIVIQADCTMEGLTPSEMLVLPGGGAGVEHLWENQKVQHLVLDYAAEKKWIAAICAAPQILGKLELLQNREAVCYPGFEKFLKGAEIGRKSTVRDGMFITSKGPGTVFDFAYHLVELLRGEKVAEQLKEGMLYDQR